MIDRRVCQVHGFGLSGLIFDVHADGEIASPTENEVWGFAEAFIALQLLWGRRCYPWRAGIPASRARDSVSGQRWRHPLLLPARDGRTPAGQREVARRVLHAALVEPAPRVGPPAGGSGSSRVSGVHCGSGVLDGSRRTQRATDAARCLDRVRVERPGVRVGVLRRRCTFPNASCRRSSAPWHVH